MARLSILLLSACLIVPIGLVGCSGSPPEPTGEAYEPPRELDEMKNQMMQNYQKGTVNRAE